MDNVYTELMNQHPVLFGQKDLPMSQTCMCWGIDCGPGWIDLLKDLCNDLDDIMEKYDCTIEATQVKEKYGTLRFYYNISTKNEPSFLENLLEKAIQIPGYKFWNLLNIRMYDLINEIPYWKKFRAVDKLVMDLIDKAEEISSRTCEDCGKPGQANEAGWISVKCDKCRNE
jgi:hypothetical protein